MVTNNKAEKHNSEISRQEGPGGFVDERGPSPVLKPRRAQRVALSDDVAGHWDGRPQYVILADANYPGPEYRKLYPAITVGLKKRRQDEVKVEKTFSVQGANEELVDAFKAWAHAKGVTIKSSFDFMVAEFLKNHPL